QQLPPPPAEHAAAAAAAAEDAVRAAEAGSEAGPRNIVSADAAAERDDANATPVPNDQANVDSFGTTPVGSVPTSLAPPLRAPLHGDADASLVAAAPGDDSDTGSSAMHVASPPPPDSADACSHRHPAANEPPGAAPGSEA
ncbi:hypothetical protein EV176_007355, partial [Coemansia sp. RSA 451]